MRLLIAMIAGATCHVSSCDNTDVARQIEEELTAYRDACVAHGGVAVLGHIQDTSTNKWYSYVDHCEWPKKAEQQP